MSVCARVCVCANVCVRARVCVCTFRVLPLDGGNRVALRRAVEDDGLSVDAVLVLGLNHKFGRNCNANTVSQCSDGPQISASCVQQTHMSRLHQSNREHDDYSGTQSSDLSIIDEF